MTYESSQRIAEWLDSLDEKRRSIVLYLRDSVHTVYPEVQEIYKYGGILFSLAEKKDSIGGIYAYTAHVNLVFSKGFRLQNPPHALQGGGKFRRHLSFHTLEEAHQAELYDYIQQLAELD